MPYAILTVVLVAIDQLVKYLVLQNIALGEHVPFIPYILDLTYVQNTGAAFSMLNQHTWLLTVVSLVMSVVLAVAIWKNFFRHPLGKVTLTLLLGGAIGNDIGQSQCIAVHGICSVQCGGHLRGGGRHCRWCVLRDFDGQVGGSERRGRAPCRYRR